MEQFIDVNTGEVLDLVGLRAWEKKKEGKEEITPVNPTLFTSAGKLRDRKGLVYGSKYIRFGWLDMALLEDMEPMDIRTMAYLSSLVVYNNYLVMDVEKASRHFKCKERMLKRMLQKVKDKGMIKVLGTKMDREGEKLIQIHPFFEFVGTHPMRETLLNVWVKENIKNNYSQTGIFNI